MLIEKCAGHYFSYSPSYICCCILNFSFLFFIESSWTSSPPRPPSPQSQTSFDTLSRNPKFFENSKKKKKKNANDLTNLNWLLWWLIETKISYDCLRIRHVYLFGQQNSFTKIVNVVRYREWNVVKHIGSHKQT